MIFSSSKKQKKDKLKKITQKCIVIIPLNSMIRKNINNSKMKKDTLSQSTNIKLITDLS